MSNYKASKENEVKWVIPKSSKRTDVKWEF